VPPHILRAQVEEKIDSRRTQEVFREDIIKIQNKEQEAIMKRR
jgi:ribosome-associated protein YbcJ (S4-like RNA binding protein)